MDIPAGDTHERLLRFERVVYDLLLATNRQLAEYGQDVEDAMKKVDDYLEVLRVLTEDMVRVNADVGALSARAEQPHASTADSRYKPGLRVPREGSAARPAA